MSVKEPKSVDEIKEEIIRLLKSMGASKEVIEQVKNAKNKQDVEVARVQAVASLMHDKGHIYMNTRTGTAIDNLHLKNPERKHFSLKEIEEEMDKDER